ncbi:peptide deformylase [Bailinhaonella thermotolerans]|uniref:Peptide deformylase n=1 Tax=Bailinhaonella thermotolerans TaxID=1070861 RepID=A0A3A4AL80_9ACTN|nr:peptide deformylase [Bailinhaonella thermotolerans]RJL27247.1 peptide deformylase [Bailinhaonella thermotolerans]
MAGKPIRLFGDPVLRGVAEPVTSFDAELRKLVKTLLATMRAVPGRAGVSAPQIGVPARVVVYSYDGRTGHLVNPTLELSERTVEAEEACLSAPDFYWPLRRSFAVVARGQDMAGRPVTVRAFGMAARVLQHEADHLDGVFFLDRLPPEERARALAEASLPA